MSILTIYSKKTILVCILAIVAISLGAASASPQLPCEFYGNISLHGSPAPAGTVITALVNNTPEGTIVVKTPGVYGGMGTFDERLIVMSTESDFTGGIPMIKFTIGSETADQVIPYDPGTSTEMKLTVGEKSAPVEQTASPSVPVQSPAVIQTPVTMQTASPSVPVQSPAVIQTPVMVQTPVSTPVPVQPVATAVGSPVSMSVTPAMIQTAPVSSNATQVVQAQSVVTQAVQQAPVVSVNATQVQPVTPVSVQVLPPAPNNSSVQVTNQTNQTIPVALPVSPAVNTS